MSTVESGRRAETMAAAFLKKKGCEILAQNWRTRWCEIDIVAQRAGIVYFCEVKYRARNTQGSGLEYITAQKLQRMRFAADMWVHSNRWNGQYQLCAIEVAGPKFTITQVLKNLA